MAAKTELAAPTIDQVRALLASMEAKVEAASALSPTAKFAAELDDHRVDPRELAAFVRKVVAWAERSGVDLDNPPAEEDEVEPVPAAPEPPAETVPPAAPAVVFEAPVTGEKESE